MGDSSFISGFRTGFGSAFFQFALERLASFGSYTWDEVQLIWGVEDELRKLQRTMSRVQDLVDHVECYPLRVIGGSKAWKIWFADMKKLSYDADSLVDYISLNISTSGSIPLPEVRDMILSSFEFQLPHEINALQNKLEVLAREIKGLLMIEKMKGTSNLMSPQIHNILSASSLIDDRNVVGREADRQKCVLHLLDHEPTTMGNFSVMSFVGMAGIGKTTLARLVYDDTSVNKTFGKKMWVSVSTKFDMIRITKSMLEAVTGNSCTLNDLNSVQVLLQNAIRGFKFLLVLDDYWNEKRNDWDVLSLPLKFGYEGSKVIVTTRSAKVSTAVKSFKTYNLNHLSDDECWDLMKQRMLFQVEGQDNLESIGREIAKKCKGLPLAAETLGSLLSNSESTENEWHGILKCKLWDLPQDNNDLFPALMLSYLHLPPQLQKCFAYCSLFPQNYEFEIEELVLLWMAEGFIQPVEGWRLEDLGRHCFNDLYSRSLFQQARNSRNQIIYRMHDLIHDMTQMVSTDICLQVMNVSDCCPLFGDTCHLSMLHDSVESIHLRASQKNKRLRTFLMINRRSAQRGRLNNELFAYLLFLRVLDLSRIGLIELTDSFDHLKYLRYLNLSENLISMLPKSVCNLLALQTLKLKDCPQIRELPDDTQNLSNLRHLDLDIRGQLIHMPPYFGRLTNLQSLSAFIVGNKEENGISQISDMDLLRGSLCITNIQVVNVGDATQAKLHNKAFLDKLELQWVPLTRGTRQDILQQTQNQQGFVLSNLRPHENLKELVIDKYSGIIYPSWFCEPNRKLTTIHLQGLKYCESLPPLGELHSLKSFYISDMPSLESVDDSFYGTIDSVKFPSLVLFEVRRMAGLISWVYTATFASMPHLNNFTIHNCPNLTCIPANLMSHGSSDISNCSNLPSITTLP